MAQFLKFTWSLSVFSAVIATIAGAAIIWLHAPAATLIFAGWATVVVYESLTSWVNRRIDRR